MIEVNFDKTILDTIESKYSSEFKNRELIQRLAEKASDSKDVFQDLIFTGKYLAGLFRAVSRQQFNNTEILNKEIHESVEKIKNIMKLLLDMEFPEYSDIFFKPEMESLLKLNSLASDLELIKLYVNDLKKES